MKLLKFTSFLLFFITFNFGGGLYAQTTLDNVLNVNPESPYVMLYDVSEGDFITQLLYTVYNNSTNDCSGGTLSSSGDDGYVCFLADGSNKVLIIEDGRGTTQDLTVSIQMTSSDGGNFVGSGSNKIPVSGLTFTPNYNNSLLFDSDGVDLTTSTAVTSSNFTSGQGPQTIYFFDKSNSNRSVFKAIDSFMLKLTVPALTHADTYTNTVTFTVA